VSISRSGALKQSPSWLTAAVVSVVLISVSMALAGQPAKINVTGVWAFTVESAAGTGTPTVTFKQEGEKLTGHYSSQLVGEAELAGSVKGQAIEFTVAGEVEGIKIELKYSGTIEGNDSMKGQLSAGELGGGTFTAKRK
jgi:hypothetical protein